MNTQEKINRQYNIITAEKAKLEASDYKVMKAVDEFLRNNDSVREECGISLEDLDARAESRLQINAAEQAIDLLNEQLEEEEAERAAMSHNEIMEGQPHE